MEKLAEIVAQKRRELNAAERERPLDSVRAAALQAPPALDFFSALSSGPPIKLIAEIKQASPSAGLIRGDFHPPKLAQAYTSGGATCLSVLTDAHFFGGSLEHLRQVRQAVAVPLLRKDFILEPYQVWEARAAQADAVLLIAECLDDCQLRSLHNLILELGMTPLVEIYEPSNLPRVLQAGAMLIGVNNRNLKTFEVNLDHCLEMRKQIPSECLMVAESGIKTRADVTRLENAGIDAMLVGESLMRQPDVEVAVRGLLGR